MNLREACVGVKFGDEFPMIGVPLMLVGLTEEVFIPHVIKSLEWKFYDDVKEVLVFMFGEIKE